MWCWGGEAVNSTTSIHVNFFFLFFFIWFQKYRSCSQSHQLQPHVWMRQREAECEARSKRRREEKKRSNREFNNGLWRLYHGGKKANKHKFTFKILMTMEQYGSVGYAIQNLWALWEIWFTHTHTFPKYTLKNKYIWRSFVCWKCNKYLKCSSNIFFFSLSFSLATIEKWERDRIATKSGSHRLSLLHLII